MSELNGTFFKDTRSRAVSRSVAWSRQKNGHRSASQQESLWTLVWSLQRTANDIGALPLGHRQRLRLKRLRLTDSWSVFERWEAGFEAIVTRAPAMKGTVLPRLTPPAPTRLTPPSPTRRRRKVPMSGHSASRLEQRRSVCVGHTPLPHTVPAVVVHWPP